jgi:hypothetical protein
MSIEATRLVWKHSQAKGSERLVLLCIADHINGDGIAWPSMQTIANETKVSHRQVRRAIELLEENLKELEIVTKGNGRGVSTVYRLSIKGDMVSPFSNNDVTVKGDIYDIKGDMVSLKGDMVSPQSLEPSEPLLLDDPIETLAAHFTTISGRMPTNGHFAEDWQKPLAIILSSYGENTDKAKEAISQAITFTRTNKPKGGGSYRISNPRSIVNIVANLKDSDQPKDKVRIKAI